MIRLYAATSLAPYSDCRGRFYEVEDDTAMHKLLSGVVRYVLVEIVIRGTPARPLTGHARSLGMQMAWCGSAWGVRNNVIFYCRGRHIEEVLTLRDELAQ